MVTAAQLVAQVSVQGAAAAASEIEGVGAAAEKGQSSLGLLAGGAALAAGAALVGIGVQATKMAGDFQSSMVQLVTGAGESQSNLKMVSDGILNLATQTGTSTKQLSDGMYMIESAGFHGAQGLDVLKAAAEGAKVGNADLGTVAGAVTTVMHDYANSHYTATQATNALITTVASGKTHMQDLAGSMSAVLPLASSLHIPFEQVSGAMATMTNAGMSAQHASQNLAFAIRAMDVESGPGTKALTSIGVSASELHNTLTNKGLPAALQLVEDHIGKKWPLDSQEGQNALKAIMGGTAGLNTALMLTGTHMKEFTGDVASIGSALHSGSADVQGWAQVQGTFNQKLSEAKEAVEVLMIKLGTALLPVMGNLMDVAAKVIAGFISWENQTHGVEAAIGTIGAVINVVASAIGGLISGIARVVGFFEQNRVAAAALLIPLGMLSAVLVQMAVTAIVAFIASIPALLAGFGAWAVAAGAAAIATLAATWPILAIGAVIGLVVAGIILAVQHWGQITAWLQGVWSAFSSWFMSILQSISAFFLNIWHGIQTGLQAIWNAIIAVVKVAGLLLLAAVMGPLIAIVAGFAWLYDHNYYFKELVDTIVNVVKEGLAWLQSAWTSTIAWLGNLWGTIKGIASNAWNAVSSVVESAVNGLVSWLHGIWTSAIAQLGAIWSTISSYAQRAWAAVTAVFASAWGMISGVLSGLWANISGWFSNLAGQAVAWGQSIIQGFISGISSMVGAAGAAAANVVNTVKGFLGFHSPAKEGEGRYIVEWGQGMIAGFSQGVKNAIPQLTAAVNMAVSTGTAPLQATPQNASPLQISPLKATSQPAPQVIVQPPPIYLDGRVLANGLMPHVANAIRYNVGTHS